MNRHRKLKLSKRQLAVVESIEHCNVLLRIVKVLLILQTQQINPVNSITPLQTVLSLEPTQLCKTEQHPLIPSIVC